LSNVERFYAHIFNALMLNTCFVIHSFFDRLRRKTLNGGNRQRKPDNVEMQRLTDEQYDDEEIVTYERTDNSGRT